MSSQLVGFTITCDVPGCTAALHDADDSDARSSGWRVLPDGLHLCFAHRRVAEDDLAELRRQAEAKTDRALQALIVRE